MRKIANTIAMENLFLNVPSFGDPSLPPGAGSRLLKAFADKVVYPFVSIVEEDCGTRLGKVLVADKDLIGKVSLNTLVQGSSTPTVLMKEGQVIYYEDLFSQDGLLNYYRKVHVRSLDSCIAVDPSTGKRGVCAKCLFGSVLYNYKVTFPAAEAVLTLPDSSQPKFFYLENVVDDTRQTYVVFYVEEGSTSVPYLPHVVEKATTASTSLPVEYIKVELTPYDTPDVIAGKTAVLLNGLSDMNGKRAFSCTSRATTLLVKHTFFQTSAITNPAYSNEVGSPYAIPGIVHETNFLGFQVGSSIRLNQHSHLGFHSRLTESYGGSLIGLKPVFKTQLPFREEIFYNAVSDNDVAVAYRELVRVAGKNIPDVTLQYVEGMDDRLDKALIIIALYSIYSFIS